MIKVFEDILEPAPFESFVSDMNKLKGHIVCPHTDRLLRSKVSLEDSINKLRPRANCLIPKIDSSHTDFGRIQKILSKRKEAGIHSSAHHGQWITKSHYPKSLLKIVSYAEIDHSGLEWWCYDSSVANGGVQIPRHTDYDGGLEMLTGEKIHPDLTFIYYHEIKNMNGGELIIYTKDETRSFRPQQNSLVIFKGDLPHEVASFRGLRRSFVLLPWKNRPREFI
ncbi:MAG: hypothetical protein CL512_05935 [Actinobacteria bacterium]|nr:hypothetical protein [Actinomycetota bacterium]